ncbi:MAG: CPBP family glutamic-type intramembrane protease [Hyphomonadaceae bacterium]|nr:CPBP family glutamic-type intramembrane protease [Hyphomonadaceae bacterium]
MMFVWRIPGLSDWRLALVCIIAFSAISAGFGLATGLFVFSEMPVPAELLRVALIAFFLPAVFEELVFRGPLLWLQKKSGAVSRVAIAVSLAAFVAWHPINAHTFMPQAADVFLDFRFLFIAALLGIATTFLALRTRSLWPPILLHWFAVIGWKACLGAPGFL